jgi:hypothetical protein
MGMFDYFRSSYDLGEQFTNVECQTKDIEEFGIGGTMTNYWLDPAGKLWCPYYRDTHTFEEITKDDERYSERHAFLNFEWIRTGAHGKYKPHPITKYIHVYPAKWVGEWEDWPTLRLHFKYGIIQEFEEVTRESRNRLQLGETKQTEEISEKERERQEFKDFFA